MNPELVGVEVVGEKREVLLRFSNDSEFALPFEYLRVYSPSAEVRGHTPEQAVLQTGKQEVGIQGIEAVGNYAIQIRFDDGHRTGIYTWEWLYDLGQNRDRYWKDYLSRLEEAGASRKPE